jgi:hypothetical protein
VKIEDGTARATFESVSLPPDGKIPEMREEMTEIALGSQESGGVVVGIKT